jgi:hypothetical protein
MKTIREKDKITIIIPSKLINRKKKLAAIDGQCKMLFIAKEEEP